MEEFTVVKVNKVPLHMNKSLPLSENPHISGGFPSYAISQV